MSSKSTNGLTLGSIMLRALEAGVPAADLEAAKSLVGVPGVTLVDIEAKLMARAVTAKAKRTGPAKPTTLSVVTMDKGKSFLLKMTGEFFPMAIGKRKIDAYLEQVTKGTPENLKLVFGEGAKYSEFVSQVQTGVIPAFLAAHPEIK